MGLSSRFRAALWLLPLLLHFLNAPAGFAESGCDGWARLSSAQKRKAVENFFSEQRTSGVHAEVDRCLGSSASRMASEISAGCREKRPLEEVWKRAGYAWMMTCAVIATRIQAGETTGATLRLEIRAAWDECWVEGADGAACQKRLIARYAKDPGERREQAECRGFLAMPKTSQLAEVEDRIRERFSTTPDVARCMKASASEIRGEVRSLCRGGNDAAQAWNQALRIHTDRCLERDTGL